LTSFRCSAFVFFPPPFKFRAIPAFPPQPQTFGRVVSHFALLFGQPTNSLFPSLAHPLPASPAPFLVRTLAFDPGSSNRFGFSMTKFPRVSFGTERSFPFKHIFSSPSSGLGFFPSFPIRPSFPFLRHASNRRPPDATLFPTIPPLPFTSRQQNRPSLFSNYADFFFFFPHDRLAIESNSFKENPIPRRYFFALQSTSCSSRAPVSH